MVYMFKEIGTFFAKRCYSFFNRYVSSLCDDHSHFSVSLFCKKLFDLEARKYVSSYFD
jgi:hypothetical protein